MELIKKYSFQQLIKKIIGQKVRFKSNCEFFPNFDVTGKVLSYYIKGSEIVFKVKISQNQKIIDVGSNMKNLQFEIK